jgi:hypothetical protein
MALVDEHTGQDWKTLADLEILRLARSGRNFTAEDVTSVVGIPPKANAVGSRFSSAARRGLIEAVGFAQSSRASRHASRSLAWRGTMWTRRA